MAIKDNNWKLMILLLKEIAKSKNITHQEIADKIGVHRETVSRFFSLKFAPSIKLFLQIATIIQVNFFFEDKDSTTDLNQLFEHAMESLGRRPDKLSKN